MKVALLGDMALFGKYSMEGNPGVLDYFADVAHYLGQFDVVVGNLETPFGGDIRPRGAKSAYIKAHPRNLALLKRLNVSIVGLANNHLFDYGREGYRATLDTLADGGIDWFGVEDRQLVLPRPGIAFHGYCSHNTNPLGVARGNGIGVNALHVGRVEARMRENHSQGLLNIVSIHSGVEHVHQPSLDDVRMARRFAKVAPYVYYGHHPHVVQGVEVRDGSLIAYSVGNFCFDDVYTDKSPLPLVRQTKENRSGLIVELDVQEGRLLEHKLTPVFAGDDAMVVGDVAGAAALERYSNDLLLPEGAYDALRRTQIDSFNSARRRARDVQWYLKRLNLRTVNLVVRAKLNQWRYRRNVTDFIGDA